MCSWPISYPHLHAAQLAPSLLLGGSFFVSGMEVVVGLCRFWHDSSPRRWERLPGHIWITTRPPIWPARAQSDALERAVWIPPTVLSPWHKQPQKNGRVAPARPQSASQSQAENSVLSCGETGNLFHPSLGLTPSLENLCKCKLEEWLKCWLLSQEAWVARENYLPREFGGVGGFGCEAEALGAILGPPQGLPRRSGYHAHFKPCAFLENERLE